MAKAGSFDTTGYKERYLVFSWSEQSQSFDNNSTTIKWSLQGAGGSSGKYFITGNFKVVIEGEVVYQNTDTIQLYHQVVASGTKTIYHNADGNKKFSASVSAGIYAYTSTNAKGSGSWDLTQIGRQATLTSAPNFNDEANPTIQYNNPAGDKVTTLEACITDSKGVNGLAGYRAISKTGSSYTFNLTTTERNNLRNYSKNSNTATVGFYIHTVIGGKDFYSYLLKTLTIINAAPSLSPTVIDSNKKSTDATKDNKKFIKGISNAQFNCGANAKKGATITSASVSCGGVTVSGQTGTIYGVTSGDFVFKVTDSRGNTTTQTVSRTCYNYVSPSVTLISSGVTAEGSLTFSATGNLYKGSFGGTNNKNFAYYRYKEPGGNFTSWVDISSRIVFGNYNTFNLNVSKSGFDYHKTYVVQVAVEDSFYFKTTNEKPIVSKPVYDWGKNDFNFNCSTITGQIFSLGGIPEDHFIKVGDDFNNYITPGIYCVGQSEYMGNYSDGTPKIKNKPPVVVAGRLIVISGLGDTDQGGTWSYITQEFHPYTLSPKFKRHASTGTTPNKWTWSDWVVELNSDYTDYIVAQATSGIWEYRKWNSGKAECWAKLYCSKCPKNGWGNLFSYNLVGSRLTLPFTFKYTPTVIATVETTGSNVWLATRKEDGIADTNHTDAYQAIRPTDGGATIDMRVDYYVYGNWK